MVEFREILIFLQNIFLNGLNPNSIQASRGSHRNSYPKICQQACCPLHKYLEVLLDDKTFDLSDPNPTIPCIPGASGIDLHVTVGRSFEL